MGICLFVGFLQFFYKEDNSCVFQLAFLPFDHFFKRNHFKRFCFFGTNCFTLEQTPVEKVYKISMTIASIASVFIPIKILRIPSVRNKYKTNQCIFYINVG